MSAAMRAGRSCSAHRARSPACPASGEGFVDCALRLAGVAGAVLGWAPGVFWGATPAELGAVLRVIAGDAAPVADATVIAGLMERFPDG